MQRRLSKTSRFLPPPALPPSSPLAQLHNWIWFLAGVRTHFSPAACRLRSEYTRGAHAGLSQSFKLRIKINFILSSPCVTTSEWAKLVSCVYTRTSEQCMGRIKSLCIYTNMRTPTEPMVRASAGKLFPQHDCVSNG